jgi:methionine-rich copper-binding protein CopC
MMKYLFTLLLLFGFASAHSYLKTSTPTEGETITTLEPVTLEFTENIESAFSFFKVYKLAEAGNLAGETERLKLKMMTRSVPILA